MWFQPIYLSFAFTPFFSSSETYSMYLPCLLPSELPGLALALLPASAAKVGQVAGTAG